MKSFLKSLLFGVLVVLFTLPVFAADQVTTTLGTYNSCAYRQHTTGMTVLVDGSGTSTYQLEHLIVSCAGGNATVTLAQKTGAVYTTIGIFTTVAAVDTTLDLPFPNLLTFASGSGFRVTVTWSGGGNADVSAFYAVKRTGGY